MGWVEMGWVGAVTCGLSSQRDEGHRMAVGHEAAIAFIGNGSIYPVLSGRTGRTGDDRSCSI